VGATGVVKPAIRVAFVLFSAAVLQRGLFSQLRIADAVVDVFLLLAIAAGISLGAERGAIFGFFAGLTLDLLLSTPLGLSALVYCLVGYGTGRLQGTVRRANRVWPLVLVATASVAAIGLYAVVAEVLGQANAISSQLVATMAVVAVGNVVVYPLARRVAVWSWPVEPSLRAALR
jgi:rod shape-determining protein MreD